MTPTSTAPLHWDNPEPGVYEALTTRTQQVVLEVFRANDDEPGTYQWWALSGGRLIGFGTAASVEDAQAQCEAVAA